MSEYKTNPDEGNGSVYITTDAILMQAGSTQCSVVTTAKNQEGIMRFYADLLGFEVTKRKDVDR